MLSIDGWKTIHTLQERKIWLHIDLKISILLQQSVPLLLFIRPVHREDKRDRGKSIRSTNTCTRSKSTSVVFLGEWYAESELQLHNIYRSKNSMAPEVKRAELKRKVLLVDSKRNIRRTRIQSGSPTLGRVRKRHPRTFHLCPTHGAFIREKERIPFGRCTRTQPWLRFSLANSEVFS